MSRKIILLAMIFTLLNISYVYANEALVLLDIPSYNQQSLGLKTGCEIVSLAMLIDYSFESDIASLVEKLPRSNNPNEGFRGDIYSSNGFTVFPEALFDLVFEYTGSAIDMTGSEIEDLKRQLDHNTPVAVWVNGLGWNVHCIVLSGYNSSGFYYNDPWTGSKDTHIAFDDFYTIWNKPIYDRLYQIYYSPRKAISYEIITVDQSHIELVQYYRSQQL